MNIPLIIGIVLFAGLVEVIVIAALIRRKKIQAQAPCDFYQQLASSLGLKVLGGDPLVPSIKFLRFLTKPFRVEGERKGCTLQIYSYSERHGKSSTTYTTCRVLTPNPRGLTFTFAREGAVARLGKLLGMKDVSTGDTAFDEFFVVKCSDEEFIRKAMIDSVKQQFYVLWKEHAAKGAVRLDKQSFAYTETGRIKSEQDSRRFEAAAELMCSLGGVVQFYNRAA